MAASATLAFNLGEWVRLGRLAIYSLYFLAHRAYQNSRDSTYRGVQICGASSYFCGNLQANFDLICASSTENLLQLRGGQGSS